MTHGCGLKAEDLGPYLLGHITPAEADRVQTLARTCDSCAADLRSLAPVVAMLRRARPNLGEDHQPLVPSQPLPPDLLDDVLDEVRRERRSARRRWLLVTATVLIAVLVGVLTVLIGQGASGERLTVPLAAGQVRGTAVLRATGSGTAVTLRLDGLAPAQRYEIWLAAADGRRLSAGTVRAGSSGGVSATLGAALDLTEARRIDITAVDGAALIEVALPSARPSTSP